MTHSILCPADTAELQQHITRANKARREGVTLLHDHRDGRYYATSASTPGVRYYVTLLSCTCLGFVYNGHCKHNSALIVAHLLQEGTSPEPTTRRTQTCERMSTPAPQPSTPERRDIHDASTGALIGYVEVKEWSVEAWAFSAWDGSPDLLWTGFTATRDDQDRAEQRIRERFFRTHVAAPSGAPLVFTIEPGEDEVRTPQGRIIGYVRAGQMDVEAWGYGADGTCLLLSRGTERQEAAQAVWRHYQRRGWAGPHNDRHAA